MSEIKQIVKEIFSDARHMPKERRVVIAADLLRLYRLLERKGGDRKYLLDALGVTVEKVAEAYRQRYGRFPPLQLSYIPILTDERDRYIPAREIKLSSSRLYALYSQGLIELGRAGPELFVERESWERHIKPPTSVSLSVAASELGISTKYLKKLIARDILPATINQNSSASSKRYKIEQGDLEELKARLNNLSGGRRRVQLISQ